MLSGFHRKARASLNTPLFERFSLFVAGSLSILSLLLYFWGLGNFGTIAPALLLVEVVLLLALAWRGSGSVRRRLYDGLVAGAFATLAYDLVRIPLVHSGLPVFKAISYFGCILLGTATPSPMSEFVGWAYHLSNGLSFGLMYVALKDRPTWLTAVLWGMALEVVMLWTPYAEVFGYQRSAAFLAITIGSHAVYGLVLWLSLRFSRTLRIGVPARVAALSLSVLCIGMIGADFYRTFGERVAPAPPPGLGPRLFSTWSIPEPDRVMAIWLMKRRIDPQSAYYFIEPFDSLRFGVPFDVPEAEIRRHGMESATEYLLRTREIVPSQRLSAIVRMTHLAEVSPWMLAADSEAEKLSLELRAITEATCGQTLSRICIERLLTQVDGWVDDSSSPESAETLR